MDLQFLDNTLHGARFSPCRLYRYSLWRRWADGCRPDHMVAFIGLNPSTADEVRNDPTVRRCINFAKAWGFGGMVMLNAFAYRATDPNEMKRQADPVGPDNNACLFEASTLFAQMIACWGAHGVWLGRQDHVAELLKWRPLFHLGLTKCGSPRHPLYLPKSVEPVLWMEGDR